MAEVVKSQDWGLLLLSTPRDTDTDISHRTLGGDDSGCAPSTSPYTHHELTSSFNVIGASHSLQSLSRHSAPRGIR